MWVLLAAACLLPTDSINAQERRKIDNKTVYAVSATREKAEVSMSLDQQMDFGQVADNDGSLVLGLNDAITSDPQFIHYGGDPYSAICTITGDPDTAVDISISTSGSNGLSLSSFISSEGALPLIGVNLDGSGELVLTIGATLTVDAASASVGPKQTVSYTITTIYN